MLKSGHMFCFFECQQCRWNSGGQSFGIILIIILRGFILFLVEACMIQPIMIGLICQDLNWSSCYNWQITLLT